MSYKVTVQPSGHEFQVQEQQTVLDAALEAGIVLPYSCKNGSCTSCQGKVLSGEYEAGNGTQMLLTEQDRAQGQTLFCETFAKSDLVIESREVQVLADIIVRKMPCRVVEMTQHGTDVMVLKLQMPANQPYKYYSGQFMDMLLKGNVRRSYSMANRACSDGVVELHIKHMPGGLFTDHVFGATEPAMKARQIMRMEGPLGSFFLRKESDKPMIFMATGTGFAPIKAMMEDLIAENIHRPVDFYWGVRQASDLYMHDLCLQWQQQLDFFNYHPVLSRAEDDKEWQGRRGYIQHAIDEDFTDLSNYQVYACGNPGMVMHAMELLRQKGLPEDSFYADAFTSEADNPDNLKK
ncbi:CDP-6-deoxy-delta-3,4-glucoseen reductase [Brackiella oedipodis]|uniref:CDP-6-deoxy-delta-3,4-glucoseen reductase n=1 Tax=Brackiella oedipodis TaxID=124225 RepID=UPI00048CADCF|nr:CDP-6-deoxy-delta-3,4-glucoseen reductase [Brackiella oedipodis]